LEEVKFTYHSLVVQCHGQKLAYIGRLCGEGKRVLGQLKGVSLIG